MTDIQYVERRDTENILTAVVRGTEANAHLVATYALAQGAEATAEQYHITLAEVHGTLAFYYENQAEIDAAYAQAEASLEKRATDGWQKLNDMRRRKGRNA